MPKICPLCENELFVKGRWSNKIFECRKKYVYLGENNPICHYHAISADGGNSIIQERFIISDYIIITEKELSKIKIYNNRVVTFLFKVPPIYVNKNNKEEVINKINLYKLCR